MIAHKKSGHVEGDAATNDMDLVQRVRNFLLSKQMRSLRHVDVAANEGRVVLRGQVGSFYEKQLCLNCARRVAGVAELVDEISVQKLIPYRG
ncbi:MAG: BON domain-containing protein [Planctomycetales bacterium]|nr:BON domain-containing protein [Planctomycetales bacterium]